MCLKLVSLLSVSQMRKKNYVLYFECNTCKITDPTSAELFNVKMKNKSFLVNQKQTEMHALVGLIDE